MNIKVLGTRGHIQTSAPYHSHYSGVLIDDKLLLDCGHESFLTYNPLAVLITHLHADHAFFMNSASHYRFAMPVYAPETCAQTELIVPGQPFTIADYQITPIPTIHSHIVRSQAYSIQHDGKKILYTGDMIWIKKEYHDLLIGHDLIITEASFVDEGGLVRREKHTGELYGHTGIPNLLTLFAAYAPTIMLVHFGSWFYKDMHRARKQLQALGKSHGCHILIGYDGFSYDL